jgi:uncharacterized tellurite resistance protein B-like protein
VIDIVKTFFQKAPAEEVREEDKVQKIQVATCALLLEVANSDDEFSEIERENIVRILEENFRLSDKYAQELIDLAEKERKERIDLWGFTRLINENYSLEEKIKVIELVWKVIYADGKLDQYEDHLVHTLSKLLKLEHKQLIDAKLKIRDGGKA